MSNSDSYAKVWYYYTDQFTSYWSWVLKFWICLQHWPMMGPCGHSHIVKSLYGDCIIQRTSSNIYPIIHCSK